MQATKVIKDARAAAAAYGCDPQSLKFFPCIVPITGRTSEEAKQKHKAAIKNADYIAGLGRFSGYTGIDMSKFPLDEPFQIEAEGPAAIQSVFRALEASNTTGASWTPRRLGMQLALGGLHPCPAGSVQEVADVLRNGSMWLIVIGSTLLMLQTQVVSRMWLSCLCRSCRRGDCIRRITSFREERSGRI